MGTTIQSSSFLPPFSVLTGCFLASDSKRCRLTDLLSLMHRIQLQLLVMKSNRALYPSQNASCFLIDLAVALQCRESQADTNSCRCGICIHKTVPKAEISP